MAASHAEAVRNMLTNFVTSLIDVGSAEGKLVFLTASDIAVATLRFSRPAFAPAVSGRAVANPITADPSAIGGIIAKAVACDNDGNEVFSCSVTAPGGDGDIVVSIVDVQPGDTVGINDGQLSYGINDGQLSYEQSL